MELSSPRPLLLPLSKFPQLRLLHVLQLVHFNTTVVTTLAMEYPDEVDNVVQLTLDQFVGQSQDMFTHVHDDLQSEIDFIRFALAGRVGPEADEEVDQCRISLNA